MIMKITFRVLRLLLTLISMRVFFKCSISEIFSILQPDIWKSHRLFKIDKTDASKIQPNSYSYTYNNNWSITKSGLDWKSYNINAVKTETNDAQLGINALLKIIRQLLKLYQGSGQF